MCARANTPLAVLLAPLHSHRGPFWRKHEPGHSLGVCPSLFVLICLCTTPGGVSFSPPTHSLGLKCCPFSFAFGEPTDALTLHVAVRTLGRLPATCIGHPLVSGCTCSTSFVRNKFCAFSTSKPSHNRSPKIDSLRVQFDLKVRFRPNGKPTSVLKTLVHAKSPTGPPGGPPTVPLPPTWQNSC